MRYREEKIRLLIVTALAAAFVFSCAAAKVNLKASYNTNYTADDYENAFDMWSRDLLIIPVNGGENVLTVRATFLTADFLSALTARKKSDLSLLPDDVEKLNADNQSALDEGHEFFVTVLSGVPDYENLGSADGLWNIILENDNGDKLKAVEIKKIEHPTAVQTRYFHFDKGFRDAWIVKFEKQTKNNTHILPLETKSFYLNFFSPLGHGSMKWETSE